MAFKTFKELTDNIAHAILEANGKSSESYSGIHQDTDMEIRQNWNRLGIIFITDYESSLVNVKAGEWGLYYIEDNGMEAAWLIRLSTI